MTLLLFGIFFLFMLLALPMGFALYLSTSAFLLVTGLKPLVVGAQRMMTGLDSFLILAVPLFILAGSLLANSGLSQKMVDWVEAMIGWLPGSTGIITIVSCTIFAALTGSGPATVAAIGSIMIPAMVTSGYPLGTAAGITAAGGALGPIIPPSTCMIVYGSVMGLSVPKLFMGGVVPGLFISAALILINSLLLKKYKIRPSEKRFTFKMRVKMTVKALPILILPVIILGGIYGGIFTPTEAATIAVFYSLCMGIAYKSLSLRTLKVILLETLQTTGQVMFIFAASNLFGWMMTVLQVPKQIASFATPYMTSTYVYLAVLALILLFAGTLIDSLVNVIILAPILVPIGTALGIDPLHLGVSFCILVTAGLTTPPFGVNLFSAVAAARCSFVEVVKGVFPFMLAVIVAAVVLLFVPQLSLWLPNLLYGSL